MEPRTDVNFIYSRLLELKKDVHDLQNSLENVVNFGLSDQELRELDAQSHKMPPALKALLRNPMIKLAANVKSQSRAVRDLSKVLNIDVSEALQKSDGDGTATLSAGITRPISPQSATSEPVLKKPAVYPPPLPKINNSAIERVVFTHSSAINSSNQVLKTSNARLEFMGDSVLNFVVTKLIYQSFPDLDEGKMTILRSSLVSNSNLLKWSLEYGFNNRLISKIDMASILQGSRKIYADVFEAYVGGIYEDCGHDLDTVERWIEALIGPRLAESHLVSLSPPIKDTSEFVSSPTGVPLPASASIDDIRRAKEKLYILMNPTFKPEYETYSKSGTPDKPQFKVAVLVNGDVLGLGEYRSIKDAGTRAAYDALVNNQAKVNKYHQLNISVKENMLPLPQRSDVPVEQQISAGVYSESNGLQY